MSGKILAIEISKTEIKMNVRVYLGLSIQDISKTVMFDYWYDYTKVKHGDQEKLCITDTDSFI